MIPSSCFEADYVAPRSYIVTEPKSKKKADTIIPLVNARKSFLLESNECRARTLTGNTCRMQNEYLFPFCKWHLASECGLELRYVSPDVQIGLFALVDFTPGQTVTLYSGEKLTEAEYDRRYSIKYSERELQKRLRGITSPSEVERITRMFSELQREEENANPHRSIYVLDDPLLTPTGRPIRWDAFSTASHPGRYVNDYRGVDESPNVEYVRDPGKEYFRVVATRFIPAGSQVLVDYGEAYWQ